MKEHVCLKPDARTRIENENLLSNRSTPATFEKKKRER